MNVTRSHAFACFALVALSALAPLSAVADDKGVFPLHEPTVISSSGRYMVTEDIAVNSGIIFDVKASFVTIDLNGHVLSNLGSATGGIVFSNGYSHIEVRNGSMYQNGGVGISLHGDSGVFSVTDIKAFVSAALAVDIGGIVTAPATGDVRGMEIASGGASNGIRFISVKKGKILDNKIQNVSTGIELRNASNTEIRGNVVTQSSRGILLDSSHECVIADNLASNNSTSGGVGGILLDSSSRNVVSGNNASNNGNAGGGGSYGISLVGAHHNSLSGNTTNGNIGGLSSAFGIFLSRSDYNRISENVASGNSGPAAAGIYLDLCVYNDLSGNTASGNGRNGMYLSVGSNFNHVQGNTFNCANGDGLLLDGTANIYGANHTPGGCAIREVAGGNINAGGNI